MTLRFELKKGTMRDKTNMHLNRHMTAVTGAGTFHLKSGGGHALGSVGVLRRGCLLVYSSSAMLDA